MVRGGSSADPPYPRRHSGVAFVCGNAWCLPDDLARARAIYGDRPIIAVNGAADAVPALGLFSYHPERFTAYGYDWMGRQRRRFGAGFLVHGARRMPHVSWVDHWWEGARGQGGSAWGARKLASLMGFDFVVLVGCPLVAGPYHGPFLPDLMGDKDVTERYAREIDDDKVWHPGCISSGGRTGEILGTP